MAVYQIVLTVLALMLVLRLVLRYIANGASSAINYAVMVLLVPVCLAVLMLSASVMLINVFVAPKTTWRSLVSIDQYANASLGGILNFVFGVKKDDAQFGNEDETVSSVLGKLFVRDAGNKFARFIYFFLDHIQENHCLMSIETDEGSGVVKEEFVPTVAEKAAIADYRERNPKSILSDISILYALGLRGDDENE